MKHKAFVAESVKKLNGASGKTYRFVISDGNLDRHGDTINPDGWELKNFEQNPIALFNHKHDYPVGRWHNLHVKNKKLIGDIELAPDDVGSFQRALNKLVEHGFVKSVSVGFQPIESEAIDRERPWAGTNFLKQELHEVSLVSVPANANALSLTKTFDLDEPDLCNLYVAYDKQEDGIKARQVDKGLVADDERKVDVVDKGHSKPTEDRPMSLRDNIAQKQQALVALRDELTTKSLEYAEEQTDELETLVNELNSRIDAEEKSLATLEAAEARIQSTVDDVAADAAPVAKSQGNTPSIIHTRTKSRDDIDFHFAPIAARFKAHVQRRSIDEIIDKEYGNDRDMAAVIKATDATPASTTQVGWAAELVQRGYGAFMESLRGKAVFPELAAAGTTLQFGNHRQIILPMRSSFHKATKDNLSATFVGEGDPIRVAQGGVESVTLNRHKLGVISTFTRELAQSAVPAIQSLIQTGMIEDTAWFIDNAMFSAGAATADAPAGLKHGVTATPSAGVTAANILTDIRALIAPMITADMDSSQVILLINPLRTMGLASVTNAVGAPAFPEVGQGNLRGYRLISSTHVPNDEVWAINASYFATAYAAPEISFSDTATLHMEREPASVAEIVDTGGTGAAPVRSLFQTETTAIKYVQELTWATRMAGSVAVLSGVAW